MWTPAASAGVAYQVTDNTRIGWEGYSLDDAGNTVYASSTINIGGTNPTFTRQLDSWEATTGAASVVASIPRGASTSRDAVSDDGAWIAFRSRGDLTGGNPDGSVELFLKSTDGTVTRQLTTTPAGGGGVRSYVLAGSGNRIVFEADIDPLGTNPSHRVQLFDIEADGTGLRQLTTSTADSGFDVSISDDGAKIAFAHRGNLTGGNADLSWEIFTILHDGTGLAQLTATSGAADSQGCIEPRVSGNGLRIAFVSGENIAAKNITLIQRIWTIDWAGTNLRVIGALAPSSGASITDDGQFVAYASTDSGMGNTDLNNEIWKIKFDGTGKVRLTVTNTPTECLDPEIAGGGGRVAFRAVGVVGSLNLDGGPAMLAMGPTGGSLVVLVDGQEAIHRAPDLTPDGTRIVFDFGWNPYGPTSTNRAQLFRLQTDGTGRMQLTSFTDGDVWHPRVSSDGQRIAFISNANPTGGNPSHNYELFTILANGIGLAQLTPSSSTGLGAQLTPAIAGNGSVIAFQSVANYTGGNSDGSPELFRVNPDGSGMLRLTSDDDSLYKLPRIDESGTWVVFQRASGVHRIRTDGSGLQQITAFAAWYPDISGTGDRIAFVSNANPLGTNADGSTELFTWDAPTSTLRQITSFATGDAARVRLSRDGAFATFVSNAPVFESNPDGVYSPYRVEIATGVIERIGALGAAQDPGSSRYGDFVALDDAGTRAVFTTAFDPVESNPDGSNELFFVDMSLSGRIPVGKPYPTVVRWDADPHAVRYDIVRGDVSDLAIVGSTVDLGPATCLANDLPALGTDAYPDPVEPLPGQAFFYVQRGSQGMADGPGSYGQGSGGLERVAGPGGCAP